MPARSRRKRIEEELAERDPVLLAAADEVDVSLLDWTLSLSPLDRLRVASRAIKALTRWQRVTPHNR